MIDSKEIELFKNIVEYDLEGVYYDLHNDFKCLKIEQRKDELILLFKNINEDYFVSVLFQSVTINKNEFRNMPITCELTIDTLYRGRYENNGDLVELSDDNRAYFYMEFYEGQKMEFWCKGIEANVA